MRNLVELRRLRRSLSDEEALSSLSQVESDLRLDAGESVPKSVAARLLGVSVTTLDKWAARKILPVAAGANGRQEIEREPLEALVEHVSDLRRLGQDRAVLAEALRRLAAENKQVQRAIKDNLGSAMNQARSRKLRKLTLPEGWHPED